MSHTRKDAQEFVAVEGDGIGDVEDSDDGGLSDVDEAEGPDDSTLAPKRRFGRPMRVLIPAAETRGAR